MPDPTSPPRSVFLIENPSGALHCYLSRRIAEIDAQQLGLPLVEFVELSALTEERRQHEATKAELAVERNAGAGLRRHVAEFRPASMGGMSYELVVQLLEEALAEYDAVGARK